MKALIKALSDQTLSNLEATSTQTIKKLNKLGFYTYWDLLNYFPYRYENYSIVSTISDVQNGEIITIKGKINSFKQIFTQKGLKIQKIVINDQTGSLNVVWYNQPYLYRLLQPGNIISVAGEVKNFFSEFNLEPREYEILSDLDIETIHTGRIIPIYSEKKGLSSRLIREKIHKILKQYFIGKNLDDIYPPEIISKYQLLSISHAYRQIHFPETPALASKARARLAFDELFTIQLAARITKNQWLKERVKCSLIYDNQQKSEIIKFKQSLPFELTSAQNKVIKEIFSDLIRRVPMNRFLHGDVGSGKTVVAAFAGLLSYLNGYQTLFMAPTEILANQHYQTLKNLFAEYKIKIVLQTRSKKHILKGTNSSKENKYDLIIGTHALLQENLTFDKVGLVIIDEQHRFGVLQRAKLKEKGINPHLLTMTATPIPRTITLTLFQELDLSVIDEMPKGRLKIKTFLVPPKKRLSGYDWIRKKIISEQNQVFIICPLIEESEVETMKSVKAVTKEYERLKTEIFPDLKLKLLHGRLKASEKEHVMNEFRDKKFDILVSTALVEVGIDIPNAALIVIEAAERFGLAQLHQLRGRVGRSEKQSYCLLYSESESQKVTDRLNFFAKAESGMAIAEYDLKSRGPGQIYGTKQHGYFDLKIATYTDIDLISRSGYAAADFISKYILSDYDELSKRIQFYKNRQTTRD